MKARTPQISLSLSLVLLSSLAVTAQQIATVPARPSTQAPPIVPAVPPDQKAYDEARRIKDPQKKI
ncbi:MAG TPA: hypothetical protein VF961_00755, partial [Pyrinomonadaceae bacterium]